MTDIELNEQWGQFWESRAVETQPSDPPTGHAGPWFQTMVCFQRHGFFRTLLAPTPDDRTPTCVELAIPGDATHRSASINAIIKDLAVATETEWKQHEFGPLVVLESALPSPDETEKAKRFVEVLEHVAEFLETWESSHDIVYGADVSAKETPAEAAPEPNAKKTEFHLRKTAAEDSAEAAPDVGERSFFEAIGGPTSNATNTDSHQEWSTDKRLDRVQLHSAEVTAEGERLRIRLHINESTPDPSLEEFAKLLVATLAYRYDLYPAEPKWAPDASKLEREFSSRASSQHSAALLVDVQAFLSRLVRLSNLGRSLEPFLVTNPQPQSTSSALSTSSTPQPPSEGTSTVRLSETSEAERSPEHAKPVAKTDPTEISSLKPAHPEPSGVIFASTSDSASREAPLQSGNYSDPRLKCPDASTPLVDVVLRHPGYSDRRIGQVLSILLSIKYSEALKLAGSAPVVIAWGIGRERAQTFKNVIEGAGGKANLVEPGLFDGS